MDWAEYISVIDQSLSIRAVIQRARQVHDIDLLHELQACLPVAGGRAITGAATVSVASLRCCVHFGGTADGEYAPADMIEARDNLRSLEVLSAATSEGPQRLCT